MTRRALVLVVVAGWVAGACVYDWSMPDAGGPDAATTDGATSDDGGADGASDAACQTVLLGPCDGVPFASGFQENVDGKGGEFCAIGTKLFDPAKGFYRDCPPPSWMTSGQVSATFATVASEDGLHVYATVDKHGWPIERNDVDAGEEIYQGDAVELFFAPVATGTGNLGVDRAVHVLAAPAAAGAMEAFSGLAVSSPQFALTSTGTAYTFEVIIPWSAMAADAAPPVVLTNYGLDVRHGGARYQAFLHYTLPDGGLGYCDDVGPKPSIDNRSWCSETVQ